MIEAKVIIADPPWPEKRSKLPGGRSASSQYRNSEGKLSFEDINQLLTSGRPITQGWRPARDCVLFMWRVWWADEEHLDAINAWGFRKKSELVWVKQTVKGNIAAGMGHYTFGAHEVVSIATKGKPTPPKERHKSVFFAQRKEPSAKPDEFYEIVRSMYDGPIVELFARKERPGIDLCLGDEVNGGHSQAGSSAASGDAGRKGRRLRGREPHRGGDQQGAGGGTTLAVLAASWANNRSDLERGTRFVRPVFGREG